jgi:DHA1 family bicyclomycin/chloramphenicol resistance-like MFS transporter
MASLLKHEKRKIVLLLGALSAVGPFSIDMYLPGFQDIARDLQTDIAHVGQTLTSYFIGISIGQLIYGPIIDRYGRKGPLQLGLIIYTVASLLCILSPSIDALIGLRGLLALGGCAGMVASRAIVRDLFPVTETAKIFSQLMLVMGAAPIIAPTVGGWMVSIWGWKSIFLFMGSFSTIMLIAVARLLPESHQPDRSVDLRPTRVLKDYFFVLKEPVFLTFALASGFASACLFSYISGSPIFYMEIAGFSNTEYGWIFGMNALGFIGGSQLNSVMLKKYDSEKVMSTAVISLVICALLLLFGSLLNILPTQVAIAFIFLYLLSLGFISPNTAALSLQPFTRSAGSASAMLGFIQMLMGALASGIISYLTDSSVIPMATLMTCSSVICAMLILGYSMKRKKRTLVSV